VSAATIDIQFSLLNSLTYLTAYKLPTLENSARVQLTTACIRCLLSTSLDYSSWYSMLLYYAPKINVCSDSFLKFALRSYVKQ